MSGKHTMHLKGKTHNEKHSLYFLGDNKASSSGMLEDCYTGPV